MTLHTVTIGDATVKKVTFANNRPLSIFCGPCAIESRDMVLKTAEHLANVCEKLGIGLVFKSSFDKANRTSIGTKRGVGIDEGLKILQEVRSQLKLPVITDIHSAEQCAPVAEVADVLQIPAFLCRQTDILIAAAQTGKAINVKKGQFLAPWDMANVAQKIVDSGNNNVLLCERGTTFGYGNLVSDMRGLRVMAETGYPVVFDATHSVQMPGAQGKSSGGKREFVEPLARAAVAVGVAGLFMESHPCPAEAWSDGPNQIPLSEIEQLLRNLQNFDAVAKNTTYANIKSDT